MSEKRGKNKSGRIRVRMLFAEEGGYHEEVMSLPAAGLESYDRLIDFLREDEEVQRDCYVDVGRLCSAQITQDD